MDPLLQITLDKLEAEREHLLKKRKSVMSWLTPAFVIVTLAGLLILRDIKLGFFMTIPLIIISFLIYQMLIDSPFEIIKQKFKSALLGQFMKDYHPNITYRYHPNDRRGKQIIKHSNLISGVNKYAEEDVLEGTSGDINFYMSEVILTNESEDRSDIVLKGLLFKINIPGKSFPDSQIQSRAGILKHLFGGFTENKEFGFSFESNDHDNFHKELSPLFPFIKHLIHKQGDIRIKAKGNEIIILLESNMKFMDSPAIDIQKSLHDKNYIKEMSKQINSLLFIIESFVNELDTEEIQERLELKSLEYIKNKTDSV